MLDEAGQGCVQELQLMPTTVTTPKKLDPKLPLPLSLDMRPRNLKFSTSTNPTQCYSSLNLPNPGHHFQGEEAMTSLSEITSADEGIMDLIADRTVNYQPSALRVALLFQTSIQNLNAKLLTLHTGVRSLQRFALSCPSPDISALKPNVTS